MSSLPPLASADAGGDTGSFLLRIVSLLFGSGVLLIGTGLFFTTLGVRAGAEQFPVHLTGVIMSAYFLGYIVGSFICPGLIRRVGHIRSFAAMASVASITPIVHALLIDPWAWFALRVVAGICLVGLYMVIESWLNTVSPNHNRGKVFSAYVAVTLIGMALGQYLLLVGDAAGFTPFALVSILLSAALVPITLTRVSEPKPVHTPRIPLRRLYEVSPLAVVGAVASGLLNGAFYGMGAVFGARVGLSEAGIAAFMSATILGGALLQWPIGHLSDRRDRRAVLVVVCFLAAALSLVAFTVAPHSSTLLTATAFFYGGLVFTVYGLSVAHVNDQLTSSEVLEATSGLLLLHGIGAAIGPAFAGLVMDELGPGSLLVYFTVVLAAMGLFGWYRLRGTPAPVDKQPYVVMAEAASPAAVELHPHGEPQPEPR